MRYQAIDYNVDLLRAILWQYNDAARLQSLLISKQAWYDAEYLRFWQDWYRDVFDLRTATDFGQSVWAIILGLPLTIEPVNEASANLWGFGPDNLNFERGNFAPSTAGISLTNDERRILLQLRYFQLVTRGAVPEINRFLRYVFGGLGVAYVVDNYDMTMTYVFGFAPPPRLLYLLQFYDVLPRPAGVEINFTTTLREYWGFGPDNVNFNRGGFAP
jgi:hypothetical protein